MNGRKLLWFLGFWLHPGFLAALLASSSVLYTGFASVYMIVALYIADCLYYLLLEYCFVLKLVTGFARFLELLLPMVPYF